MNPSSPMFRPNQQSTQYSPMMSPRPQRPRFGFHAPTPYPRPRSSASKPNPCSFSPLPEESNYESYCNLDLSYSSPNGRRRYNFDSSNSSCGGNSSYVSESEDSYVTCTDTSFPGIQSHAAGSPSNRSSHAYNYDDQSSSYQEKFASSYHDQDKFSSWREPGKFSSPYRDQGKSEAAFCARSNYESSSREQRDFSPSFNSKSNFPGGRSTPNYEPNMAEQPQQQQEEPKHFGEQEEPQVQQEMYIENEEKPKFKRFGTKRKAANPQPPKHCELCNLEFTSQIPLDMHLRGAKHMKKLKAVEALKILQNQGHAKPTDTVTKAFRCDICDVTLNGALQLQTHFEGTKHKNKAAQAEQENALTASDAVEENGNESSKTSEAGVPVVQVAEPAASGDDGPSPAKLARFACDLCNVTVNSQVQLQQHLESKRHQAKLQGKPYNRKKWRKNKPTNGGEEAVSVVGSIAMDIIKTESVDFVPTETADSVADTASAGSVPTASEDSVPTASDDSVPTASADSVPTASEDSVPTVSADIVPTAPADTVPTVSADTVPTVSADTVPTVSADIDPTVSADIDPTVSADIDPTVSADIVPTETADIVPTESADIVTESPDIVPSESADIVPTESADIVPNESADIVPAELASCVPSQEEIFVPAAV